MIYFILFVVLAIIIAMIFLGNWIDSQRHGDPVRIFIEDALVDNSTPGQWHRENFLPALELARRNNAMVIVELECVTHDIDTLFTNELFYTQVWQTKIPIHCYHEFDATIQELAEYKLATSARIVNDTTLTPQPS